ncbi:GNAT family N-acetyltransferase [Psychrobium sp. nBUS_13]|uniref:GNAT family N-acetyltransferase n=1 Tax=Psychrobium sp. nBUS_13 TaxID=3395319 RepID=UPI003EB77723
MAQVIYDFSSQHLEQLHQLYQTVTCVNVSQVCIGLLDDNERLVGFTRVITDGIFKAVIFDVVVSESQRGKKLGLRLMDLVKSHSVLKDVQHVELYCLPEMESFYSTLGFPTELGGVNLMRFKRPNA